MAEPFLGQIKMFAGNFAPVGHLLCRGQLIAIQQNTALFSLLGTQYGGNGTTNFAIPDLQSRVPVGQGQLAGGQSYVIGEQDGVESVTLTTGQLPAHNHGVQGSTGAGTTTDPTNQLWATEPSGDVAQFKIPPAAFTGMSSTTTPNAGGGAHSNIQPCLCINFIIATQGVFPSRN